MNNNSWTTQDDNDDCLTCGWYGGDHSDDCKHNPITFGDDF